MSTGEVAVFHGPGNPLEIREVPLPEMEPDAAPIRVSPANVCGSDLHFWRGDAPLKLPQDVWIFGHEKINDAFAQSAWHAKDTTTITLAAITP